ncbi:zinc finger protein 629-like [Penaeus japonicus]|uniref:zinc finger protein 629-like n=1 Tax=Penaeus japonicus TaxID=27405 RepID=UPI001C70B371|nr:zinc finger protein 629-like [Penaeus japonicus]
MRADSASSPVRHKHGTLPRRRTILPRPFMCNVCYSRFSKKYFLQVHYMIHTGERPHKCDICGTGFRMRWRVALHRRTHTGEKPYACPVCDFRANRKDNLRDHVKRRHGGVHHIQEVTNKNRKTVAMPKKRRKWKREYRRVPKKEAQELSQEWNRVSQQPPPPPLLSPSPRIEQDPLRTQPPPSMSTVIFDDPEPKKNGRNIRKTKKQLCKLFCSDGLFRVPCHVHIKEEPPETVDQCARPRREAASLGCIRRLSMMLDEEDIKKEIDDEDTAPQTKQRPKRKRPRSFSKQLSSFRENEDPFEVLSIWPTEKDLLFTDDYTLKLEEDIDLLE